MKSAVLLLILLISFMGTNITAQNITGQYYGIGNVTKDGNYSQYLTELIVVQKGNTITGEFNYYFKASHITSKVKGVFNSGTRLLKLQLVPVLNYKAASSLGADCPMQGYFVLRASKIETTLSGQFEAIDGYKYTCPSIFIKLKKEMPTEEDKSIMKIARAAEQATRAYDSLKATKFTPATDTTAEAILLQAEKEIREAEKLAEDNKKQNAKYSRSTAKTGAKNTSLKRIPVVDNNIKTAKPVSAKIDSAQAVSSYKKVDTLPVAILVKPAANSIKEGPQGVKKTPQKITKIDIPTTKTEVPLKPAPVILKPADSVIAVNLLRRTFEESTVIEVEADSLFIALYDNGEIDGDTVALFHNRKLLLSNQELNAKPINLVIPIDTTVHEISMYAENLGTIPPNTAICVIIAGGKRYELTITSNFIRNGTIRFRKKTAAQIEREKKYL